jgi:hypothetical protein
MPKPVPISKSREILHFRGFSIHGIVPSATESAREKNDIAGLQGQRELKAASNVRVAAGNDLRPQDKVIDKTQSSHREQVEGR